ncbi:MAG: hypothetical protein Q8S73_25405 [Deltaproteobacteria bacterium]|nr:hypothetical protein [Myxococcales bacterium]MDP3217474.1 hypothetical protein [Deltaproteobacteria bacterium]
MRRTMNVALASVAALVAGARAQACTPPTGCEGAGVFPLGETLPSSATALEWWMPRDTTATDGVRLERLDAVTEAWVEVPLDPVMGGPSTTMRLRPITGFLPDARYRVSTAGRCATWGLSATRTFRTTGPAPLPTSLGTLTATPPAREEIQQRQYAGSHCADLASAMVSVVTVAPSADAAPWASMLVYEARVDGAPFVGLVERGYPLMEPTIGGTHHGRGTARLAVICGPAGDGGSPVSRADGLSEGDHEVVFSARVAGTTTTVETAPLRVTLRCPTTTPDAGAVVDAGTATDLGGTAADVTSVTDVGTADVAAAADAGGARAVEAGCSVGAGGGRSRGAWLAVAAAMLLGRRLRRREARR